MENIGDWAQTKLPKLPLIKLSTSAVGKFGYFEPNYALDVIKVNVPVTSSPAENEQFTITLNPDSSGIKMDMAWDKVLVQVPIVGK